MCCIDPFAKVIAHKQYAGVAKRHKGAFSPPIAIKPPISPITSASQGRITLAGAVMDTRPPSTPAVNSPTSMRYLRLRYMIKLKITMAAPPAMAPFIVTTATRPTCLQ